MTRLCNSAMTEIRSIILVCLFKVQLRNPDKLPGVAGHLLQPDRTKEARVSHFQEEAEDGSGQGKAPRR